MDSNQNRQNTPDLNFGIPQSQIFVAGDKDIKTKVLGQTSGRGVDVILSCSKNSRFHAYWECLAPFGRVIDAGGDDGIDNPSISIGSLPRGASFTAFDLELLRQFNPAAISRYESLKLYICSENSHVIQFDGGNQDLVRSRYTATAKNDSNSCRPGGGGFEGLDTRRNYRAIV